jgi:hypothetical protein
MLHLPPPPPHVSSLPVAHHLTESSDLDNRDFLPTRSGQFFPSVNPPVNFEQFEAQVGVCGPTHERLRLQYCALWLLNGPTAIGSVLGDGVGEGEEGKDN